MAANSTASDRSVVPEKQSAKELEGYKNVITELRQLAELDESFTNASELGAQAVNRITAATTIDDVFDATEKSGQGLISMGREWGHLGDKINVLDVRYRRSDPKYVQPGEIDTMAVVQYALDDGEVFVVGTGAENVVVGLRQLQKVGAFRDGGSVALRIRTKDTTNGKMLFIARP